MYERKVKGETNNEKRVAEDAKDGNRDVNKDGGIEKNPML